MKRLILILTIFIVSGLGFSLSAMDMSGSSMKMNSAMFMGYLSDVMSAETNKGVTVDKIDLKLHPEKLAVAKMKTPPSALSGYGIFVKGTDGKYLFHRFDKKGTDLSKELLKKTSRKEGMSVHVMGELKDNIIYVESIQEM